LLAVPINVLWAPAQACIERNFRYRQMGLLELGGDIALYGTAVPLAMLGFGDWSLVAGYFAWQTWLLVGSIVVSGLRPRWAWSNETARELTRHGIPYSSASLITRLGGLVNPEVVGRLHNGAAMVGFVAFAQRLVDVVGFAQRGAYRLGLVALSRVPDEEQQRLRYGVEEGSVLQLLSLALPFAAFGIVAHWLIPVLFGRQWSPAVSVYTLLAMAAVLNASGIIQTTLMYARGKNLAVARVAVVQTSVLWVSGLVLIPVLGVNGFGVASLIALVDLIYIDRLTRRTVKFSYRTIVPFALALAPPVLFPFVGFPYGLLLLVPMALVVFPPSLRAEGMRVIKTVQIALKKEKL
jgi:PST family polysaccharide transporter